MAKPNFKFEKRQKELDRKKKQEEKLQRKQGKTVADGTDPDAAQEDAPPAE